MNEDDFEKKLRALAGDLRATDRTALWKGEILGRARREGRRGRVGPPRGLMIAWGAAWAAILLLTVATPKTSSIRASNFADKPAATVSEQSLAQFPSEPQTYALLWQHYHFSRDLP